MFKILIDTCVWLDLAKDHQGQGVLGVLETPVREKQVSIILPRTVLGEFKRNKARVAEEGSRSLSTVLKRAKEVVHRLGDAQKKRIVLDQLNDVDYKLPSLGESAIEAIGRIEMSVTI
jgi:PIN domain